MSYTNTPNTWTTEDGATVTLGSRVFNYYDMVPGTITAADMCTDWFDVEQDNGTTACLNGERVCTIAFAADPSRGWVHPAAAAGPIAPNTAEVIEPEIVYPNPVAAWCRSTTDTDQRTELVARVLRAAAESSTDPEMIAALDDIAAEHRYLSRVWDRGTEAADHFEKLAAEWMQTARVHLATATDDDTDPADRSHAVYLNGTAHARGSGFREAADLARRAMQG